MKPDNKMATIMIGLKTRNMEIPALLSAVSSKFSPNFPKVINDESNTDSGKASGKVMREK
jgi:hypothetical protein